MVMLLTIRQSLLLVVAVTMERLLALGTHKVLKKRNFRKNRLSSSWIRVRSVPYIYQIVKKITFVVCESPEIFYSTF